MAKKDFLKDMKKAGPSAPMAASEDEMNFDDMEMPEMEGEEDFAAEESSFADIEAMYNDNEEFKAKVDELAAEYAAEEPEAEEGDMDLADDDEEDLFA